MRTFFLGLVAAVATLVSGEVAQAGFVSGSIHFAAATQNDSSGTLLDPRTISDLVKSGNGSGDFKAPPAPPGGFVPGGTLWQSFNLINPMSNRLTLSTAAFGTFDGFIQSDTVTDNGSFGSTRTIIFSGSFLGGTMFDGSGKQGRTAATLRYTLIQTNIGNSTVFESSINMITEGTEFVPEPASMAIFGIGAIGFAARRFRRK